MRVSRAQMDQNHERIVAGAARLLRERGIETTSVADVMQAAGLTHGGFYRHFETKDALVAAAVEAAFSQMLALMDRGLQHHKPDDVREAYHDYYLSEAHLGHAETACPVATLAGDVARAGPELKESFGQGVGRMIDAMARCQDGKKKERRAAAIRQFAMLVGAAVIARACDPETAKDVLAACRSDP